MNVDKMNCIKSAEDMMLCDLRRDMENSPMVNTPFEGMAVIAILHDSAQSIRKLMREKIEINGDIYTYSLDEVEEIVSTAYNNLYNRLIDN